MWSDAYLKKCTIPVVHPNNVSWGALTSLHSSFTNCAVPAMFDLKPVANWGLMPVHLYGFDSNVCLWYIRRCFAGDITNVLYTLKPKIQHEFKTCQCWETQPPNQVCELHFRVKSTRTVILQQLGALTCSPQSRSGSYVHPKTRCMLEVLTHSILYHSWWKPYRSF